jgi:hypothetical protein
MSRLTCSQQGVVCGQRETFTDIAKYTELNSEFCVPHKWDVRVLVGYSILHEWLTLVIHTGLISIIEFLFVCASSETGTTMFPQLRAFCLDHTEVAYAANPIG